MTMNTMKRSLVVLLTLLAFNSPSQGDEPVLTKHVVQAGEVLQYKVKWSIFRLGTVILKTIRDTSCGAAEDIKVIMTVKSNPDLSFIWIQELNECVVDTHTLDSKLFHAWHRNGEQYNEIWHVVDKPHHCTYYQVVDRISGTILASDTLREVESFVEGPSLFMAARCLSRSLGTKCVPTLVGGQIASTELVFGSERELIDIGAVETPVRVRKFLGVAHWQGGTEAGLGGEFTGWISDDDAAVPILSEVKVILGSIRLELESWSRPGWEPPSAQMISSN